MVLFEMLDSYITNPVNEIRKIEDILNRKRHIQYDGTYSLKEVFGIAYTRTQFASLEPTINSFLTNIIYKDYSETDYVKTAICYRCLCEFLLAIIDHGIEYYYLEHFEDDVEQLKNIINLGLEKSGYVLVNKGKHRVTSKKDEVAELIATTNKHYNKNILDYLLAKTTDEKEKVLTALAIQLEGREPKDKYSKDCGEWVQLLRHKEEKIKEAQYSWFFSAEDYGDNLDKLFRIYLSIVSHDDCHDYLEDFKKNRGDKR